jgi:hypothetical protein
MTRSHELPRPQVEPPQTDREPSLDHLVLEQLLGAFLGEEREVAAAPRDDR